jgi:hypothetical protein
MEAECGLTRLEGQGVPADKLPRLWRHGALQGSSSSRLIGGDQLEETMMNVRTICALAALGAVFAAGVRAEDVAAPKIAAIHAQLFHESTGQFSDDLLKDDAPGLWNTIIGENASNFTFVTVEVRGKNVPQGKVRVEIVARNEKRAVRGKSVSEVSIYDQKTKFFAPLWLNETGCEELEISARLIGKGVASTTVKKTIPFKCGE